MRRLGALLVSLAAVAYPTAVYAHGGHGGGHGSFGGEPERPRESRYRVEGTITSVQDDTVEVKIKDGTVVKVSLTPDTQYRNGKERASSTILAVGSRVKIDAMGSTAVGILSAKKISLQKQD